MFRSPLTRFLSTSTGARSINRSSPEIQSIIRVDHAGELGADRIYAGQMAVLGQTSVGPLIQHMWEQEKEHKAKFEELINKYRVRPTALVPIWNVAGFVLGAVNKELLQVIKKFRDDEQEHHDTGIDHGAEQAPFYKAFSEAIKLGCKAAIAISKVV
ncbi:5-demethoxyubiquinone hydroxylase [Blattella germanica]|nr:5-demethoxyubiquinone hydroxylase [Blattella germanica]